MLSLADALLLVPGVLAVLLTPGPTNTVLAVAGLQQGVRRSLPLIGAELCGYLAAISGWGGLLVHAARMLPWLPPALRIASGLYIAYLAIGMWRTAVALPDLSRPACGWRALFVATLCNPKALLFAGTIFPRVAFRTLPGYAAAMSEFACLLVPVAIAWIAFGAALGSGRLGRLDPAQLQRGASMVLGVFSLSLVYTAFA
jgi:threonine/homoserine/homoserine lactone efflux protein